MNSGFWTLRKAVTLSAALNVFLVFLVAAHIWRHQHYERQDKLERFLAHAPSELSKEDARTFEAALAPDRPALMAEEVELKRARERVVQALKAEPFDPQAFQRAVEEARLRRAAFESQFLKSFTEAAQRISSEGRRRLSGLRVNPG
jgi:uncharacterized membrane protein